MTDHDTGMLIVYICGILFIFLIVIPQLTRIYTCFKDEFFPKKSKTSSVKINQNVKHYFDNMLSGTNTSSPEEQEANINSSKSSSKITESVQSSKDPKAFIRTLCNSDKRVTPRQKIEDFIYNTYDHKLYFDMEPAMNLYLKLFACYYKELSADNNLIFSTERNRIITSAILTYSNLWCFDEDIHSSDTSLLITIFDSVESIAPEDEQLNYFILEFIIFIRTLISINASSEDNSDRITKVINYYKSEILKTFDKYYTDYFTGDQDITYNISAFINHPDFMEIRKLLCR